MKVFFVRATGLETVFGNYDLKQGPVWLGGERMAWILESGRPIYQQLAEIVRHRIMTGEYPQGSRIPAVRDLAVEAGVNPNTMQKALNALEESGIVYSQRTAGRFVTEDENLIEQLKYQSSRKQIQLFIKQMQSMGYRAEEIPLLVERAVKENIQEE